MLLRGAALLALSLVVALGGLLVLHDAAGPVRYGFGFAAWYVAGAIWLTTSLTLMRQRTSLPVGRWIGLGALVVAAAFAIVLSVARGGGPDVADVPAAVAVPAGTLNAAPSGGAAAPSRRFVPATPSRGATGAGPFEGPR